MYQESSDRMRGGSKADALLVIGLIVFFFLAGGLATMLRSKFGSNAPLYLFALIFGAALYFIYRIRIVGWRYTVFHSEPETEYDPRFDEYITHEDHPYPVGTIVIERTVSAKGAITEVINPGELAAVLAPGESAACDREVSMSPIAKERSSSLIFVRGGVRTRVYCALSDTFIAYAKGIAEQNETASV